MNNAQIEFALSNKELFEVDNHDKMILKNYHHLR
jgi:hypothetical protein